MKAGIRKNSDKVKQSIKRKPVAGYKPNFTEDWFSENIPNWERILARFAGMPGLRFLEVGPFEGCATCWLLSNILTHNTSKITCIDTFKGSMEHKPGKPFAVAGLNRLYDRFLHNIHPFRKKIRIKIGLSQELLRKEELSSYDFVYIDGSHKSADVLEDAVLSFRLLKPGGIMIFDDYRWKTYAGTLNNPRPGIDAFLKIYREQYKVILKDYQVAIKKHLKP